MKLQQVQLKERDTLTGDLSPLFEIDPHLILLFSSSNIFKNSEFLDRLKAQSSTDNIVGCSTAGEVSMEGVQDNTTVLTAIRFENQDSKFKIVTAKKANAESSFSAGEQIAKDLNSDDCVRSRSLREKLYVLL